MQTDPIADMLTRIRNAAAIAEAHVDVPASKFKKQLALVLIREGYLKDVADVEKEGKPFLRIGLKYGPRRKSIIHSIQRVSTPGRRAYASAQHVPVIRGGLGVAIISTSSGLLTDRQAANKGLGGEVLA